MQNQTGSITQIIGPIVDVKFTDTLPEIYNALTFKLDSWKIFYL